MGQQHYNEIRPAKVGVAQGLQGGVLQERRQGDHRDIRGLSDSHQKRLQGHFPGEAINNKYNKDQGTLKNSRVPPNFFPII